MCVPLLTLGPSPSMYLCPPLPLPSSSLPLYSSTVQYSTVHLNPLPLSILNIVPFLVVCPFLTVSLTIFHLVVCNSFFLLYHLRPPPPTRPSSTIRRRRHLCFSSILGSSSFGRLASAPSTRIWKNVRWAITRRLTSLHRTAQSDVRFLTPFPGGVRPPMILPREGTAARGLHPREV